MKKRFFIALLALLIYVSPACAQQNESLTNLDTNNANNVGYIHDTQLTFQTATLTLTSTTTLAQITGASCPNIQQGYWYHISGRFIGTANASGGIKFGVNGTATWTTLNVAIFNYNASTLTKAIVTALNTAGAGATTAWTDVYFDGFGIASGSGTLFPQAAQNATFATSTTVTNGYFKCERI